jgi:TatD DNase family protein
MAHGHPHADLSADRAGGAGLSRRRTPDQLPGLVDSHAHLQHEQFDGDREAVIGRAAAAGLERILVPGWDLRSSEAALELAERHAPFIDAAVGVHPHHAAELDEAGWARLEGLLVDRRVRAVGEIGLDHFRNLSPPDVQRDAFRRQLHLADRHRLPVVVHDRDAHEAITDDLLGWPATRSGDAARGVLHAFSGGREMAERLVAAGFLISFALPLAFRSAVGPRAAAPAMPEGSFLLETDAPYLGPVRDGRNEPTTVLRVVAELARLRAVAPETLVRPIRHAYDRLAVRRTTDRVAG